MVDTILRTHVPRSAAALSYYLTISVFPFLICLSAILGSLHVEESVILTFLKDLIPEDAFITITEFLGYIGGDRTALLLSVGLAAMVTSSSAAFRSFIGIMGEIQGKMRFSGVWGAVFSFVFSIVFLAAIYISGLVILSGEWLIQILENYLDFGSVFALWTWVRFVLLFLILFCIIFGIYIVSAPGETKKTQRLPGAFAASAVLVAASMIYSRMISASIKYALVYGSLASFIIMMIWLYTCGIILILGNIFNISLHKVREITPVAASKRIIFKRVGSAIMALFINDSEQEIEDNNGEKTGNQLETRDKTENER